MLIGPENRDDILILASDPRDPLSTMPAFPLRDVIESLKYSKPVIV
jgi:hypothetical protein